MKVLENIAYAAQYGTDGVGDLYLPESITPHTRIALLIHGGGWNSLEKSSFAGVAIWLCDELGIVAYNINYRLCGTAPLPACCDDSLAAADFMLKTEHPALQNILRKKLWVIGASAGGHLALMTGLRLPPEKVAGIVSISGIAEISEYKIDYKDLFGHVPDESELRRLNPSNYLQPTSPPILCTHDIQDNVVPIESAKKFLAIARAKGVSAEEYYYEKSEIGFSHRIWIPDSSPHKLYPELEARIEQFIRFRQ